MIATYEILNYKFNKQCIVVLPNAKLILYTNTIQFLKDRLLLANI